MFLFGGFDSTENEPSKWVFKKVDLQSSSPYQVDACFSGQLKDKVRTKKSAYRYCVELQKYAPILVYGIRFLKPIYDSRDSVISLSLHQKHWIQCCLKMQNEETFFWIVLPRASEAVYNLAYQSDWIFFYLLYILNDCFLLSGNGLNTLVVIFGNTKPDCIHDKIRFLFYNSKAIKKEKQNFQNATIDTYFKPIMRCTMVRYRF